MCMRPTSPDTTPKFLLPSSCTVTTGRITLATPMPAPCSATNPARREGVAPACRRHTPAIAIIAKQPVEAATVEANRSVAISTRRPATCMGPMRDAATTARPASMPRSSRIGSTWEMSIPWSSAARKIAIASSQNTGLLATASAWPALALGSGACIVAWTSAWRHALHTSGTATAPTAAANTRTAPRQPNAPASRCALGNATVPARPATTETMVIARRARCPVERTSTAKQASYRVPDIATPSPIQMQKNCHGSVTTDSSARSTAPSAVPPVKIARARPRSIRRPATGTSDADTTSERVKAKESSVFDQPRSRSHSGRRAGKE